MECRLGEPDAPTLGYRMYIYSGENLTCTVIPMRAPRGGVRCMDHLLVLDVLSIPTVLGAALVSSHWYRPICFPDCSSDVILRMVRGWSLTGWPLGGFWMIQLWFRTLCMCRVLVRPSLTSNSMHDRGSCWSSCFVYIYYYNSILGLV